jgi:serine/threonine-protein kinase
LIRLRQGRIEEARQLAQETDEVAMRALGAGHYLVVSNQVRFAMALRDAGRYAAADSLLAAAIEKGESILGPEHPLLAEWIAARGQVLNSLGSYAEAEDLLRRSLAMAGGAGLSGSNRWVALQAELATVLQNQGRLEECLDLRRQVLGLRLREEAPDPGDLGRSWNNLGTTYRLLERYAEAERAFLEALPVLESARAKPVDVWTVLHNLGKTRLDLGRAAEAEATLAKAAAMMDDVLPEGHPNRAVFATTYGRALSALGRADEARARLTEARDTLAQTLGPEHPRTKEAAELLAALGGS